MTAVEWLIDQIKEYDFTPISNNEEYVIVMPQWIFNAKRDEAKEMEKKQCGRSFNSGYNRCEWDNSVGSCYDEEPKEFEQYYNETYGSKGSDETKTK